MEGDSAMHFGPRTIASVCTLGMFFFVAARPGSTTSDEGTPSSTSDTVSYHDDVFPIIKRHCLPCHAEENYNPSELSLDSYAALMEGGKHGDAVIAGNAPESTLIQKLHADPPFGRQMPLQKGKKGEKPKSVPLDEEEIATIERWISQGARDN
jgi:hypothetical protein